ncbi:hypothetical protein C8R46DRAFT_1201351 [Mycena filopes]|nr:hypothetical protein C8R46DRAFT_1201351 [Mycena filopes]
MGSNARGTKIGRSIATESPLLILTATMHADLRLKRLSRLPAAYRNLATSAAKGITEAVYTVCALAQTLPTIDALRLLPVFYVQFDPTQIPDVDEGISDQDRDAIERTFASMKGLLFLLMGDHLSEEVAIELWPRVWKWMEFLWTYPQLARATSSFRNKTERWTLHYLYGGVCVCFSHRPRVAAMMDATPGVWMLLTEHWVDLLRLVNDEVRDDALLTCVCENLECLTKNLDHGDNFQHIVDGAGGSLDDLASLTVEHTRMISRFLYSAINDVTGRRLLRDVLAFLLRATAVAPKFMSAVLNHGFIALVVEVYRRLAESTLLPAVLETQFFRALREMLGCPPGYTWVAQSIKAGLIPVLFSAGQRADVDQAHFKCLLGISLRNALVYYSVLSQLQSPLNAALTQPPPQPHVRPIFKAFVNLAADRLVVKQWYDSPAYVSRQACDNMECETISKRQDFRRCSGCLQTHYCSAECQAVDWKASGGGHRSRCHDLRSTPKEDPWAHEPTRLLLPTCTRALRLRACPWGHSS